MKRTSEPEELDVPKRVHIIPMGFEKDRIYQPPIETGADKVILLRNTSDEEHPRFHEQAEEILKEHIQSVEYEECDIFDLYDSLGMIAELITRHNSNNVFVNLATGSKVTAIAGMIACMATDGNPYYVRAKEYGRPNEDSPPEYPLARNTEKIIRLPHYHIDKPSADEIAVLNFLMNKDGSATKKQIIAYADQNGLEFMTATDPSTRQGKYRLLESHVLEPLRKRECIDVVEEGRHKKVRITKRGKNTLRAFDYQLRQQGFDNL